MRAEIFFFDDKQDENYHPSESLQVIASIRAQSLDFFEGLTGEVERDPALVHRHFFGVDTPMTEDTRSKTERIAKALRASRLAGTGGEKLSVDEIIAWDELVHSYILPFHKAMIEKLAAERAPRDVDRAAYDLIIGSISDKIEHITTIHDRFMEHVESSTLVTVRRLPHGVKPLLLFLAGKCVIMAYRTYFTDNMAYRT
ncbi:hypothetical protein [Rhizobium sp. MHM7A]|uniref:hypothetical protein n=1 Tax=Rhizobium sp. MHM7A TaxID=2583233 RepID=UPI0011058E17|nr:hypothetical protein [Rhizobium sp. MHM7A]TLX16607.1 hypothetical protein FFR93_04505 [Rhizobium sp. MHM7A]